MTNFERNLEELIDSFSDFIDYLIQERELYSENEDIQAIIDETIDYLNKQHTEIIFID